MIKIENTEVFGWEAAIRGMRNPMNSWDKSDSFKKVVEKRYDEVMIPYNYSYTTKIGENDLKLMQNLSKAGNDHGKFLRMINVTMDVTAPLYWWKEADTYSVGKVQNSCSTMHKIHAKEFAFNDFSHEHLLDSHSDALPLTGIFKGITTSPLGMLKNTITVLNKCRELYLETKDKKYWWQMIQLLPSSYNQRRTVQLNYQVLKQMYHARKNHKLDEWHDFCAWCETLPYFKELV